MLGLANVGALGVALQADRPPAQRARAHRAGTPSPAPTSRTGPGGAMRSSAARGSAAEAAEQRVAQAREAAPVGPVPARRRRASSSSSVGTGQVVPAPQLVQTTTPAAEPGRSAAPHQAQAATAHGTRGRWNLGVRRARARWLRQWVSGITTFSRLSCGRCRHSDGAQGRLGAASQPGREFGSSAFLASLALAGSFAALGLNSISISRIEGADGAGLIALSTQFIFLATFVAGGGLRTSVTYRVGAGLWSPRSAVRGALIAALCLGVGGRRGRHGPLRPAPRQRARGLQPRRWRHR